MKRLIIKIFFIVISISNVEARNINLTASNSIAKEKIRSLQNAKPSYVGLWGWEKDTETINFSLTLKRVGANLVGTYCYAADNGDTADCPTDEKVSFTIPYPSKNVFTTAFTSNNTPNKGIVKISIVGKDLIWEIIKKPVGKYLCPTRAKLIRNKVE